MILNNSVRMLRSSLFRSRRASAPSDPSEQSASQFLPKYSRPDKYRLTNRFYPLFWGTTNPDAVAQGAQKLTEYLQPGYYFADNLLTWGRNLSMFDDAPFVAAWQANAESQSDQAIAWRPYVLACAAYHCIHLEGDFIECGAYTGVGIKTIVDYLGGTVFPKPSGATLFLSTTPPCSITQCKSTAKSCMSGYAKNSHTIRRFGS
jgi:O-methyltransferase